MRAERNVIVHVVNHWIKMCAYFVQMLVVGFTSLVLFNQMLVYEVWPKTFKMLLLLAKIEGGDLIALEAKYHLSCTS